ncbi:SGNH/GDSL hydrolase family protein [Nocardia sp. NBC_00565]|uniref:SGNH/GDSL hydrolase family protein n=1 Tax=Nocardia sp. NBC_00565 TaxID=2975993 RepID=UPI002E818A21|nr:SGNH/GDSL hydrolase family protein [Nocardia sp. NBC_00565]WUC03240.1 SGNH/GDSL hydrolase family protein [Nocardia sp. NBC_00565]
MQVLDSWKHLLVKVGPAVIATTMTLGASVAIAGQATADPAEGVHYVALGDSFAAGAGVFPQADITTCLRSAVNYPSLVAKELGVATFKDVTCGGATLDELTEPQRGIVSGAAAPQFDALTPDTTLVTMTMGGNDIGLAKQALLCGNLLPEPNGTSCADAFTADGVDTFAERTTALAPVYGTAIDEIRSRAPQATVVIVGYPTASQPGACPAQQPAWPRDADYLQAVLVNLNALLRKVSAEHGAIFVDTATSSIGHDMCAAPEEQWINGLIPSLSTPSFVPLHPNTFGEENIAKQVVAALR